MLGLTGCIYHGSSVSSPAVGLEMKSTATYDIIGDATGTSTGAMLFGFIPIGCENKYGEMGQPFYAGGFVKFQSPVEAAAIYNAIESVPTADAIMAPRFVREGSNYIVYRKETVTVKGKAIRYNKSAE